MPWGPVLECAFATQPMSTTPTWTDITAYVQPPYTITLGRPDEFSAVRPATLTGLLEDLDGRFTFGNTAGAYYPNVKPGRRIRLTVGFTPKNWCVNPTFDVDINGWSPGGSVPPTLARTTTTTHSGAGALLITWGTGGTFPQAATTLDHLKIGRTYTASAWVNVPATNPALKLAIGGGPVGSPSTITGSYQQITLTFTATATTHSLQVWPDTSPTSGQTGRVDDVQAEEGSAVTTFDGTPPVIYPRFDGHVNGWPTAWQGPAGQMGVCEVTATDRFQRFGRTGSLRSMIEEEILRDAVTVFGLGSAYYTLAEKTGVVSAANQTKFPQRNSRTNPVGGGGGTITFGQSTGPGTDGLSAPLFAPASATAGQCLEMQLDTKVGFFGLTLECFMRADSGITTRRIVELLDYADNSLVLNLGSAGKLQALSYRSGALQYTLNDTGAAINDNATHHVAVTESVSGSTITSRLYLDGSQVATTTYTGTELLTGTRLLVGGRPDNPGSYGPFAGTLAHVAAHSSALAAGRISDHANAGLNGLTGERTDQRVGRIADWIGIPTADRNFDVGDSTVGPQSTSGKQAVDAMQEAVATEQGVLFISGDNKLTFHKRSRRYNVSPAVTLDAATIDPGATFPGDDFGVTNDMTVSRAGNPASRSVNQTSIDEYGLYRDSADIIASSDAAAQAVADWRVNIYGTPRVRIPNFTVDISKLELSDPSLMTGVLTSTISTQVRLGGLPTNAPATNVDVFIEGWTEQIDGTSWVISWNCSPGDIPDVWQLGTAGFSELGTTTKLGQ